MLADLLGEMFAINVSAFVYSVVSYMYVPDFTFTNSITTAAMNVGIMLTIELFLSTLVIASLERREYPIMYVFGQFRSQVLSFALYLCVTLAFLSFYQGVIITRDTMVSTGQIESNFTVLPK